MRHLDAVQRLVDGHVGADPDRRDAVFGYLVDQPDQGVPAALECLLETRSDLTAEYVSQYLALVPEESRDKVRAAERLRGEPELAPTAAWLVPWLPAELIDGFIADSLDSENADPQLADVLYEIAAYHPERLRPFMHRIEDEHVQRGLLSGGLRSTADSFLSTWRSSGELRPLVSMALMRTERAVHNVLEVRDEVEDSAQWQTLLELAGRLPGTGHTSGSWPAFMAFVAQRGGAGHVVGGSSEGDVPVCSECDSPAAPLLRLSAAELPYDLQGDPEFYWYSCDCEDSESLTVRTGPGELTVYDGSKGAADPEVCITPGQLSLVLEKHPNQVGVSLEATPGGSLHQVGGLPRWSDPDVHPECPECGEPMPYLATMDCGKTPFGDMEYDGVIYCFWCDGCRVSSTHIQH